MISVNQEMLSPVPRLHSFHMAYSRTYSFPEPIHFCSQNVLGNWRGLGFPSASVARKWRNSACGIACLKMVLDTLLRTDSDFYSLLDETYRAGGYREDAGWIHQTLADVALLHGVSSKRIKISAPETFIEHLTAKELIVASVGLGFDGKRKNGHLILVSGCSCIKGNRVTRFTLHDPRGSQDVYEIDADFFWQNFSGNCIAFFA